MLNDGTAAKNIMHANKLKNGPSFISQIENNPSIFVMTSFT